MHTINEADCVYGIYKRTWRAPTKENTLVLVAVDIGGKNTQKDQISCPHSRSRDQRSVGGHPRGGEVDCDSQ